MNKLVALCAVGAEKILGNEIKRLGYKLCEPSGVPGRVTFLGSDDALFRANLCLRTADRVYLCAASFNADNFDLFFDGVYAAPWQNFFKKDSRVVVDKVRIKKSVFNSERTIQAMTQKAIYQKLGDAWQMRSLPESGKKSDVRVYIEGCFVQILLDLSGEPLYKRGYRANGGAAPLRETVAATLLQMTLWKRRLSLCDPFCGSGTIAAEALLYAHDAAPGLGRDFAVENLAFFKKDEAQKIRKEEAEKIRFDIEANIFASDADPDCAALAKKNCERAALIIQNAAALLNGPSDSKLKNLQKISLPKIACSDFKNAKAPSKEGVLISNPPYGERLGDEENAQALYREMACLFENFPNWKMGFVTSRTDFQKCVGRYATLLKDIKAGKFDTRFYIYGA